MSKHMPRSPRKHSSSNLTITIPPYDLDDPFLRVPLLSPRADAGYEVARPGNMIQNPLYRELDAAQMAVAQVRATILAMPYSPINNTPLPTSDDDIWDSEDDEYEPAFGGIFITPDAPGPYAMHTAVTLYPNNLAALPGDVFDLLNAATVQAAIDAGTIGPDGEFQQTAPPQPSPNIIIAHRTGGFFEDGVTNPEENVAVILGHDIYFEDDAAETLRHALGYDSEDQEDPLEAIEDADEPPFVVATPEPRPGLDTLAAATPAPEPIAHAPAENVAVIAHIAPDGGAPAGDYNHAPNVPDPHPTITPPAGGDDEPITAIPPHPAAGLVLNIGAANNLGAVNANFQLALELAGQQAELGAFASGGSGS